MAGIEDLRFGLAKVLSFVKLTKSADVTLNPGGGANITAKHVGPAGDDSQPLPGDFAAMLPSTAEGSANAVGYVDDKNPLLADAGEKRLYSRDANGAIKATVWLTKTGDINMVTTGNVNINGVTIDPSGAVVIPTSLKVAGKEFAGHDHDYDVPDHTSAIGQTGDNN